ncbi:non-ribosomal peptide synthetase [Umezawaea tangerina]|uniref:Amino acid adenylation domain-containing protein n=1 Tax=Umezawaea tangerina TaxID=84725 RepID=A0A2T0STQ3_9PSEU|nr:non-ribosomal peptide synthetase [Umezawaea tangerina]PRY36796.1 amino acid adenylation domain-containing protein [Umezawaea tangerina]
MTADPVPLTLAHRFDAVAARFPDREAVVTPTTRWTYAELDGISRRIASSLVDRGLRPGDRVGLLFPHEAEMIAALLGVLRAGMAYVPLDTAYPEHRLGLMVADAGVRTLVTAKEPAEVARRLAEDRPVLAYDELVRGAASGEPAAVEDGDAYVLFTSGSTGRPKVVRQTHRNVLHHARAWIDGLGITPEDRLSLQSAYSWDSAVQDTFAALLSGAALYPLDFKTLGVTGLLGWMAAERVTVYHSTLPIFRALVAAMRSRGEGLPAMRMLALGGDSVHDADLEAYRELFGAHCEIAGAYGSSECSCALLRVAGRDYRPPTGVFPLGFPVAETTVRLVDGDGRTVDGEGEGEVVVVSPYLSPSAHATGDAYPTGDLARRLPDGTLLLLGRKDFQVKIGGIRVETAEVESVLKQLPEVDDAVVTAFTDARGELQLAAYVVTAGAALPGTTALRAALRLRLPDHAVPTRFVRLDALPVTANHKIDRAALPDPRAAAGAQPRPLPGSLRQQEVLAAWRDVLDVAEIGLDDNFFDLGGTSLRMAAVHERLTRVVAPWLRMTDLYGAPTIRRLTGLLSAPLPDADGGAHARGARRRALVQARRGRAPAHRPDPTTDSAEPPRLASEPAHRHWRIG